MRKFLIPLVVCFLLITTFIHAQVPLSTYLSPVKSGGTPANLPELACDNKAGTFKLSSFVGQSNSTKLDTIYLCYGDSIFIDHNGDSVLVGDPVKSTPAGIVWGFYKCKPTITGPTLRNIVPSAISPMGDPCGINKQSSIPNQFTPIVAKGNRSGDIWFSNVVNGDTLRARYGVNGRSVLLHFAPMTIDRFSDLTWESDQPSSPPGSCINVNTDAAFAVYYLSKIRHSGLVTNFDGNDCIGAFTIEGGIPDTDPDLTYNITISLKSNPGIKGLIRKPQTQLRHGAVVEFTVPQPGVYTVKVEDGKSCDYLFDVNMAGCTPADNFVINFPADTVAPGKPICVPVTVKNFKDLSGLSFSIQWDPTVLQYSTVQNYAPGVGATSPALNDARASQGQLGFFMLQNDPNALVSVPDNSVLFEICFTAIGPLKSCSGLTLINNPSQIEASSLTSQLAVAVDTGFICIENVPLVVDVALQDSSCAGTARIKVTASGGSNPYDITYQPLGGGATGSGVINQSGGTFLTPALPAGKYIVCWRDENGLGVQICDTVEINLAILGTALDLAQLPRCFGDANGTVTAQIFRGSTPDPFTTAKYTLTWSAPLTGNTVTQTNLRAGQYAVTVRDNKTGCTAVASGTLGQPIRVSEDSISVTAASCSGVSDGAIFYRLEGGTPLSGLYNFTWRYSPNSNITPVVVGTPGTQNPLTLNNRAPGIYYLEARDGNGCTFRDSVTITATRTLSLTPTVTNARCSYSPDGSAVVNVTANPPFPNPNYVFTWSPAGTSTSTATSTTNTGLRAGKYLLTARETSGCSISDSITIGAPAKFALDTANLVNPTCLSPNNGSIQVAGQGGTGFPNYTYTWSNGATSRQVTGLSTGTYTVTATDNNGCRDSLRFSIRLPNPPVINPPVIRQPVCGDDGCITVTSPANGATYQWRTLQGGILGDTSRICNLPGDTFVVVVRDALSCESRDTFVLTPVVPLSIAETVLKDPGCAGTKTGSIRVTVAGGSAPYSYSWTPSNQVRDSLVNAGAGTYIFRVFDGKDCELRDTFELKDPPAITPTYSGLTPASCFDSCNAGATVVVRYNTTPPTNGAFDFKWDDEGTDSVRINLCPGTRYITITDMQGCVKVDSVEIQSPPPVGTDTLFSLPASCFGRADGSATIAGEGGNGSPYSYQWSNAQSSASINSLTAGTYSVTVRDSKGCQGTFTIDVTEPDSLVITQDAAVTKQPSCFNSNDGVLGVTIAGGNTGSFTFNWSDGVSPLGNTNPITALEAGSYNLTVTDPKGCSSVLNNLSLTNPPAVQGRYAPIPPIRCNGEETTLNVDTIFGGRGGPYQYSIDNGVPLSPNTPFDLGGGEHIITYFDGFGCAISDSFSLREPSPITVAFDPNEIEIELGDSSKLIPIIGGAVVDSFVWSPANLLRDPKLLNPTVWSFESETFTLTVFDENGCVGSGTIVVNIDANRNIYMPNIFHPGNPRGTNDYFNVQTGNGVELINYLRVFDRWGTLMYEKENFDPPGTNVSDGWDGRYEGRYVNPGVYIYILEARFLDGRKLLYRGDVTVVR
jgi:hypothetical protein